MTHGRHNIRNGIVWAQTGHSTGTWTVTLHVIEPNTQQIRIVFFFEMEIISATTRIEFESAN